ncbi:MAG: bifunctional folylpolyglutamate synthase/dihydrofolate synthase [Ponticaulis sp.]|nr:bifunctional folylpolyglutamate synthase/dihydrofolate synthase [Ponticaulis sp.]
MTGGDLLSDLLAAFDTLPKPSSTKLSTDPVERVLEALGRPQDRLPPVIHIAGTNGKGSTTAFMRAIAEAHGLKVHVDTSPHLIRVNERIRLAGELISDDALRHFSERVLKANAGAPLSFFEGMTAIAYLAFSEVPADLTLVEVGLGGRFDSTNVFRSPSASVITPIDYDHRDFLGRHLCQIAWEKAGIIKSGSPAISAEQAPDVRRTLEAEARYRGAPFTALEDVTSWEETAIGVRFQIDGMEIGPVMPGLSGPHQVANAALAMLALKRSDVMELEPEWVSEGLRKVDWPARLQTLQDGPLTRLLPGKTVLLDGGHNPHAALALKSALAEHAPVPVALAMLRNKDVEAYLSHLAPLIGHLAAVPMGAGRNCHDTEHVASVARKLGIDATAHTDLQSGLSRLSDEPGDHALICGSLYLAGDVLSANGEIIA